MGIIDENLVGATYISLKLRSSKNIATEVADVDGVHTFIFILCANFLSTVRCV
jgi:hypothetical protein